MVVFLCRHRLKSTFFEIFRNREAYDLIPKLHFSEILANRGIIVFCFLQGDSPYGQKEAYIKLEQLGEGSYATVFKGYSK